ncbi:hypothetical protein HanIR_Chr09g0403021 [Helianthus annuus]|nr:hypothetical protein HanIR_Chr09g0403021 [Helianthus annuus]
MASYVWQAISNWCNVTPIYAFLVLDLLNLHKFCHFEKKKRKVLQGIIMIACWCTWKARNDTIFSSKETTGARVIEDIKSLIFLWTKNRSPFKAFKIESVV